jgi:hypothetical protein
MQTRAMTLATSRPAAAARQLERLARAVESGSRSTVGDWHFEQTLSLASIVRSEAHEHRQSADTLARLVEHHEAILRYQQRALVSALASQALELAAIDDRAGAAQALRRAAPWAKNLRPAERLFELARKAAKRTARRKRATG